MWLGSAASSALETNGRFRSRDDHLRAMDTTASYIARALDVVSTDQQFLLDVVTLCNRDFTLGKKVEMHARKMTGGEYVFSIRANPVIPQDTIYFRVNIAPLLPRIRIEGRNTQLFKHPFTASQKLDEIEGAYFSRLDGDDVLIYFKDLDSAMEAKLTL